MVKSVKLRRWGLVGNIWYMEPILNIAAYHFVPLGDLATRRRDLKRQCVAADLRGTILLSPEGINLFIAGRPEPLRKFLDDLRSQPEFTGLDVKESWSDDQPFNRMLVRLKKEIISMGIDGIDPRNRPSPKLTPLELKRWLDEGRDFTLLDVRNDYEVGVGTFEGATAIGLDHFRHFPAAISSLPDEWKQRPVVMFCTGGIRCEKAGPLMQQHGYEHVYQLDGGILKYFEDCGGAHFQGDCFVFDKRVALNPKLEASGLGMCFACQAILTPDELASPDYRFERSCPRCYQAPARSLPAIDRDTQIRVATTPLPGSVPYDNVRPIRITEAADGMEMMPALMHMYAHFGEPFWREELLLGRIRLGDHVADASRIVKAGQRYAHWFPDTVEPDVNAEIGLIYEDDALLVVDKPAPIPVHPSGRFNRNTLTWILRHALNMPGLRPVHRLDANTTGVAVFAKTRAVAGDVQRQFEAGQVEKHYVAKCIGVPQESTFTCDVPITDSPGIGGGRDVVPSGDAKPAVTHFTRWCDLGDGNSIVHARPITGRTNQIRIHLWHLGHPILGDPMYLLDKRTAASQTIDLQTSLSEPMHLHAWRISIRHPASGERVQFESPAKPWFASVLPP